MNFKEELSGLLQGFYHRANTHGMNDKYDDRVAKEIHNISDLFIKLIEEQPSLSIIGLDTSIDRQALINAIKGTK